MTESKRQRILNFLDNQDTFLPAGTIARRTRVSLLLTERVLDKLETAGLVDTGQVDPDDLDDHLIGVGGIRGYRLRPAPDDDDDGAGDTEAEAIPVKTLLKRRTQHIRGLLIRYLEFKDIEPEDDKDRRQLARRTQNLLLRAFSELDDLIELERQSRAAGEAVAAERTSAEEAPASEQGPEPVRAGTRLTSQVAIITEALSERYDRLDMAALKERDGQ